MAARESLPLSLYVSFSFCHFVLFWTVLAGGRYRYPNDRMPQLMRKVCSCHCNAIYRVAVQLGSSVVIVHSSWTLCLG